MDLQNVNKVNRMYNNQIDDDDLVKNSLILQVDKDEEVQLEVEH
jgi:hypothetical protein